MLIVVLTVSLALGLTGCVIPTITDLTEEQEELITEYAAGLIKKYDVSVDRKLLTDEELEKATQQEEEQKAREELNKQRAQEYLEKTQAAEAKKKAEKEAKKQAENEQKGDKGESVATGPAVIDKNAIETYFGKEGLSISYKNIEIADVYPDENAYFGVEADEGKKLLVVNINVSNTTGEDIFLDMFSDRSTYTLKSGDEVIPADTTVLLNDFSIYKDTVPGGSGIDTVLLFEVPEDSAIAHGDSSGAVIGISGSSGSGVIELY